MTAVLKPERARNSDEWTEVAAEWLKNLPQQLWREHSDLVNARLIDRWLPRERRSRILKTDLFDEVAARGLYPVLASRADEIAALDISPMVAATARKRYPRLAGLAADVRSIPLKNASVDAIVSLSTLDHFDSELDIRAALTELHRVLKPGGTLILTLDNPANPVVALRNSLPYALSHALGLVPYPVGKTLAPRMAVHAVREAGFLVEQCTAIMHAPRVVAIPVMDLADESASPGRRAKLLKLAMLFEKLEHRASRFRTGHFIAIRGSRQ